MSTLIIILSIVIFAVYINDIRTKKFKTKDIVMIGMFSAISYILYMIQFIKYPQGGGISLFSMMPTMLLAILYGRAEGVTCGLIFGLLKLLNGAVVVHPAQFLIDYLLSTMALGLAATFGTDKKSHIFIGCLFATAISVFLNIVSGVVYFGQYAPQNMNPIVYSCVYNISSAGVEGLLTSVLILFIPIQRFRKALNLSASK